MEGVMKKLLMYSLILAVFFMISCDSSDRSDSSIPFLSSDLSRNVSPDASPEEQEKLIAGNTAFAFDLYAKITDSSQNIIYSPYSISLAMAMVWGGAENNTADEMAGVFHFSLTEERFHPAFNAVDLDLRSREYTDAETGAKLKLTIANSFWGQRDYHFLNSYLDLLALNYGAGIYLLDFMSSPDKCTGIINGWIEEKTEGLIKDAIPIDTITTDTRLVLANTIYFYANWLYKFSEDDTTDDVFYPADSDTIATPTMHQQGEFKYHEDADALSVELPYAGNKMSMLIVMPANDFSSYEAALTGDTVSGIVENLTSGNIKLSLPKFKVEYTIDKLVDTLKSLGMVDAFTDSADFSGITGNSALCITDVIHKAVITVDETGTEAAAVTVAVFAETAVPEWVSVIIDRPFLFFIRDMETGSILFMGRVLNPAQGE